nr:hypothetical protein 1 [bacterium]
MKFFEVFRAGTYPQGFFSEKDVEALAKNYDPKFCEAPITLDHEQRGPAFGWVSELKTENGKLKASFRNIADELKEFVQSGKYKKISVEIYKELEGRKPYLKAVSFLGAGIPQVKGMDPVEFKDAESETYLFDIALEESKTEPKTEFEALKEIVKLQNQISEIESRVAYMIDKPDKDDKLVVSLQKKVQELSAQMKNFEKVETARQKTEQELSELKQKVRNNEFEQFLNEQISTGNLTPAQKDMSLRLFVALDNVKKFADCSQRLQGELSSTGTPFNASNQGDESDHIEEFKKFLKSLPQQVELCEIATKKGKHLEEEEFIEFANASEDSLAIYKEAKNFAEKENISFKDALLRISDRE